MIPATVHPVIVGVSVLALIALAVGTRRGTVLRSSALFTGGLLFAGASYSLTKLPETNAVGSATGALFDVVAVAAIAASAGCVYFGLRTRREALSNG